MTARELRKALFELDNQQVTIDELRFWLFQVQDQDAELQPGDLREIESAVEFTDSLLS